MADIALRDANKINVVESLEQNTAPAGVAITAGQAVMLAPATGRWALATSTRCYGIATKTVRAGEPLTAIRKGVLEGYVLDGLAYDADVYANHANGNLADAATATPIIVGRVIAGYYNTLGRAHDKLLLVEERRA